MIGMRVLLWIFLACAVSYGQTASDDEQVKADRVGVEGMSPIYGTDVEDGVYRVSVESSSSMFRVEEACLTVKDHVMTADLTLSGTGYLALFMGTKEEAAEAEESAYIGYEERSDGRYTYTVCVEALDQPMDCAAFSKKKERWYDRQILFRAESLPREAVLVPLPDYEQLKREAREKRISAMAQSEEDKETNRGGDQPEDTVLLDGEYSVELDFLGGTGRTKVVSPTVLTVKEGRAWARIVFTSPNYDYVRVGEETYYPVQGENSSVFEIPVVVFDRPMTVIGDTTAMSTPHEVEYQLTFHLDSAAAIPENSTAETQESDADFVRWGPWVGGAAVAAMAVAVAVGGLLLRRKKKRGGADR